jgi:enoyl-[acyl-carrier protein] reductase I
VNDTDLFGLSGRNAVVLGVADASSIAWGITRALVRAGARVHVGYQQRFFSRVRLLVREEQVASAERCDVCDESELAAFFGRFESDPLDVLVHAIAYAPPETFTNPPSAVGTEAFAGTLDVSVQSLARVVGFAKPYLREWGSVVTLSFQAATRALPMYGTMGVAKAALESLVRYLAIELGERRIRVNAISPGPVATLAALGPPIAFIREPAALERQRGTAFRDALELSRQEAAGRGDELELASSVWASVQREFAARSAIPETITQDDIGACAAFLASDLSRKITGQVIHVDCGLSASMIL